MVGFSTGAVSRLSMAYSVIAAKSDSVLMPPAEISGCWELAPAVIAGAFLVGGASRLFMMHKLPAFTVSLPCPPTWFA